jgi:16S rRNA (adenine1518-N6/adenine1519-N6)-dimethyltransferase
VARRFGVRYQRRWGQNFLADREQLDRIVDALQIAPTDRIVEVGPGLGALTVELASRARAVTGVEIDPACVKALGLTLRDRPNVRIVEADILRTPVSELLPSPYRVAGNIPYNLTGALFVHLLEQPQPPARIDLLVQKEVAERLVAPPGDWSLATLGVRVYGRPELTVRVPRRRASTPTRGLTGFLRIRDALLPGSSQAADVCAGSTARGHRDGGSRPAERYRHRPGAPRRDSDARGMEATFRE